MPAPAAAVRDSRVTLRAFTLLAGVLAVVFGLSFFFSNRGIAQLQQARKRVDELDRKSTRLNSSHDQISYAVFCLKKKKKKSRLYLLNNKKNQKNTKYLT